MNAEEINEIYFGDVDLPINPGRREFIKKLGAGLFIIFSLQPLKMFAEEQVDSCFPENREGFGDTNFQRETRSSGINRFKVQR